MVFPFIGIAGMALGLLGAAFFGRKKEAGEEAVLDKKLKILEDQQAEEKKRLATLNALAIPKVGRQRGTGSLSPLGGLLPVPST